MGRGRGRSRRRTRRASLIANESRRFLSFGAWTDADSVEAWRGSDEVRRRLGRCREVCEEFEAHDFLLVAGSQI
jgi:heme-degrading monooxygenase HmoA